MKHMSEMDEQRVAGILGYLAGALFLLGGLLAVLSGTVALVGGRVGGALDLWAESVLLLALGGITGFFTWLGRHDWSARPGTTGIMLTLVAVVGVVTLGFGANVLAVVATVLVFLTGALLLIRPAGRVLALPAAS